MAKPARRIGTLSGAAAAAALAAPAEGAVPAALTDPPPPSGLQRIPFLRIARSHLNPRRSFDDDAIRDLAESIARQGLLQNLVVRQDPEQPIYWIVAGERRYRAIELLMREDRAPADLAAGVPCKVIEADDAQHLALALLENLQRVDVNPMEEAQAFAQLRALDPDKWTTEEIAKAIGKIRAGPDDPADRSEVRAGMRFVQQRLALVEKLAPEAQEALRDNRLTFSQARALSMAPPEVQRSIVADAESYPTEAAIRRVVTRAMYPMDMAVFPPERWTGPIVADPETGERFYPDKVQFLRLQREAAEQKAEEMRGKWAWAEVADHCPYGADPNADRTKAGCLVVFQDWSGHVHVREGVIRSSSSARRMTAEERRAEEAERRAEEARQALIAAKEAAAATWRADLGAKVATADDVTLLMALLLLDRMQAKQYGNDNAVLSYAGAGLPDALFRLQGPLASFGGASEKAEQGRKRIKDSVPGDAILAGLLALPPAKLTAALGAWIAGRLRIHWYEKPHPALVALSQRFGVPVPPILLGEDGGGHPQQTDIEDAIAGASPQAAE